MKRPTSLVGGMLCLQWGGVFRFHGHLSDAINLLRVEPLTSKDLFVIVTNPDDQNYVAWLAIVSADHPISVIHSEGGHERVIAYYPAQPETKGSLSEQELMQ